MALSDQLNLANQQILDQLKADGVGIVLEARNSGYVCKLWPPSGGRHDAFSSTIDEAFTQAHNAYTANIGKRPNR